MNLIQKQAQSLGDMLREVSNFSTTWSPGPKDPQELWFRGQPKSKYGLLPGLYRPESIVLQYDEPSPDAQRALVDYLESRAASRVNGVFLVDKGRCKGKSISVRGIQKRMEHYARLCALRVSCHPLRHTMATQLLNADAALVSIQDLLGHTRIRTTQRYCRVSNLKVQRDYQQAIAKVIQRQGLYEPYAA
jgi:hypothetical protein